MRTDPERRRERLRQRVGPGWRHLSPNGPPVKAGAAKLRGPSLSRRHFSMWAHPPEGKAMRTPFIAALLTASLAWMPPSSATAQQVTERQTAFESLADSQWVRLNVPHVAGRYEGRLLQRGPTTWFFRRNPSPCGLRPPRLTHSGPGETRVGPARLWERWSLVRSVPLLGAAWAEESGIQSRRDKEARSCRSPEGLDWLGARYSGASSGSPHLNGTAGDGVLVGGGGGLVVGAVIGALVGAFTQSWHRQYP